MKKIDETESLASEDQTEFEVERILSRRKQKDGLFMYHVKWAGYGLEEATWETMENLSNVQWMIDKYDQQEDGTAEEQTTAEQVQDTTAKEASQSIEDNFQSKEAEPQTVRDLLAKRKRPVDVDNDEIQQQDNQKQFKRVKRGEKYNEAAAVSSENQQDTEALQHYMRSKKQNIKPLATDAEAKQAADQISGLDSRTSSSKKQTKQKSLPRPETLHSSANDMPPISDLIGDPKSTSNQGSFSTDTPQSISKCRMQTGRLFLTVQWSRRGDGTIPTETVYSNAEIKRENPLLLCEFYERTLKVTRKT